MLRPSGDIVPETLNFAICQAESIRNNGEMCSIQISFALIHSYHYSYYF